MDKASNQIYDAHRKEEQLRAEAETWDTSNIQRAEAGDIPILDLQYYFTSQNERELDKLAEQLLYASTKVGFYYIKGHGIPSELIDQTFDEARRFHDLDLETKMALKMDRNDWPVTGVGYLPFQNRKLPTRKKGNANEAFIIKRQLGKSNVNLDDNQWLDESALPKFRARIEQYARAIEELALKLLPVYCRALGVSADFFD